MKQNSGSTGRKRHKLKELNSYKDTKRNFFIIVIIIIVIIMRSVGLLFLFQ